MLRSDISAAFRFRRRKRLTDTLDGEASIHGRVQSCGDMDKEDSRETTRSGCLLCCIPIQYSCKERRLRTGTRYSNESGALLSCRTAHQLFAPRSLVRSRSAMSSRVYHLAHNHHITHRTPYDTRFPTTKNVYSFVENMPTWPKPYYVADVIVTSFHSKKNEAAIIRNCKSCCRRHESCILIALSTENGDERLLISSKVLCDTHNNSY